MLDNKFNLDEHEKRMRQILYPKAKETKPLIVNLKNRARRPGNNHVAPLQPPEI